MDGEGAIAYRHTVSHFQRAAGIPALRPNPDGSIDAETFSAMQAWAKAKVTDSSHRTTTASLPPVAAGSFDSPWMQALFPPSRDFSIMPLNIARGILVNATRPTRSHVAILDRDDAVFRRLEEVSEAGLGIATVINSPKFQLSSLGAIRAVLQLLGLPVQGSRVTLLRRLDAKYGVAAADDCHLSNTIGPFCAASPDCDRIECEFTIATAPLVGRVSIDLDFDVCSASPSVSTRLSATLAGVQLDRQIDVALTWAEGTVREVDIPDISVGKAVLKLALKGTRAAEAFELSLEVRACVGSACLPDWVVLRRAVLALDDCSRRRRSLETVDVEAFTLGDLRQVLIATGAAEKVIAVYHLEAKLAEVLDHTERLDLQGRGFTGDQFPEPFNLCFNKHIPFPTKTYTIFEYESPPIPIGPFMLYFIAGAYGAVGFDITVRFCLLDLSVTPMLEPWYVLPCCLSLSALVRRKASVLSMDLTPDFLDFSRRDLVGLAWRWAVGRL